ncbi:MAG TPA: hypothetical protein VE988_08795 [Gemmataceae bacterium]|nr:hypothetical protein [Gemmataceae bacterium]
MTIVLTDEQHQALRAEQGKPVDVVDPGTNERYVLVAYQEYERVRSLMEPTARPAIAEPMEAVPAGILRSQQAFWRDLPHLLAQKKLRGHWVCYRGNERLATAPDNVPLIRKVVQLGIPDDEYYLGVIRPHHIAPWETEEIEPIKDIHKDQ